ncbi:hypothetical protein [Brevibacillus reuszeri]|uniref:hypothetical protein n=1 Tax=Brevibacillus reuszeri TaxID=54915 RepID=UPI00289BE3D8|nr:hypothetical protein [Brevibacillus reuszeri]
MKNWVMLTAVGFIVIVLVFTWLKHTAQPDELSLQDYLHTDFSGITKIAVRYSDGNQLTIEDSATIYGIVSTLKELRLQKSSTPAPVGFLYYMDLYDDSQVMRYSSTLVADQVTYLSTAPKAKELDSFIVKMGREKIPGLLSGITEK